jgi:ADP-heptose:LPS heptosyltransferase
MRILVSNPDNIGDFVLRQPMYAALAAAGHELCLAVRSFVAPIVPLVAPGAQAVSYVSNPYSPAFDSGSADIRRVLMAAQEFAPDVYCIAPYQRTVFDELLAQSLKDCCTVGMTGFLYPGDINAGLNWQSRIQLDRQVAVFTDQHELEKNERLCGELLGKVVRLPPPEITVDSAHLRDAQSIIARLGLAPGQFWIASIGQNQYTAVKNWDLKNWAGVFSHAVNRHGKHFLLIGTPDERAASEEVRCLMGSAGDCVENLCDTPADLCTAAGLIQLSEGYIGRDSGPMHLAAGLGKPVIAIFGGGNWPRFTPRPKVGFVASVVVPCTGCNWLCHLAESYCVKRVPVNVITEAFDCIQAGEITGLRTKQLPIENMLTARIARESAQACQDLRRHIAAAKVEARQLLRDQEALQAQSESDRHELVSLQSARQHEQELSRRRIADQEEQIAKLQTDIDEFRAECHRTRLELAGLLGRSAETDQQLSNMRATNVLLTQRLATLKARRDDMESKLGIQRGKYQLLLVDAEKQKKIAEAERQNVSDVLKDLVVEHTALKQESDQQAERLSALSDQRRILTEELGQVEADLSRARELIAKYDGRLKEFERSLKEHQQSISFRLIVLAGRPIVAVQRLFRSLLPRH